MSAQTPADANARAHVHDNHGSTPAAWTMVAIVIVAFLIGGAAVWTANVPLFWASVGIVVVGLVVGKVMAMAGLGKQQSGADH